MPEPQPVQPPSARASTPHRALKGQLAEGAVVADGETGTVVIPISGCSQVRLRGKVTGGTATLQTLYLRPDGVTPYAENQPEDIDLTDGAEFIANLSPSGESRVQVNVNADGGDDITIVFLDAMALPTA